MPKNSINSFDPNYNNVPVSWKITDPAAIVSPDASLIEAWVCGSKLKPVTCTVTFPVLPPCDRLNPEMECSGRVAVSV